MCKLKKLCICLVMTIVMSGFVACSADNGTDKNDKNSNINSITDPDGKDDSNLENDMDNLGDDIRDGVDDLGNDIKDGVDDLDKDAKNHDSRNGLNGEGTPK